MQCKYNIGQEGVSEMVTFVDFLFFIVMNGIGLVVAHLAFI